MIRKGVCLGVFLLLLGCSEVSPFIDARREAGQSEPIGQSGKERIAVCYNAWWHNPDEVRSLAEQACAEQGKQAVSDGIIYFNCRLATPSTAFFLCR